MRQFIIVGHKATTSGDFSLDDMPGSAGRIDILARCVTAAYVTSFDIRRGTQVRLILLGEPDPPKTIRFEGSELKHLNPDERSAGALIKKALQVKLGTGQRRSTRGVYVGRAGLAESLNHSDTSALFYLHEHGKDVRGVDLHANKVAFILGGHLGLFEEEARLSQAQRIRVGPIKLHTDQCIILVHNELDRSCST
ncbi:MAG: tRNA (pseudouridine(54)-N(1))-methyltransferase TrmY [Euryarchaeota archaeon]